MEKKNSRAAQTLRFLKWVREYCGLWYLICTPDEEHMSPDMMKKLIGQLAQERFYEMIFVLLTVHRKNPYLLHLPEYLLLDSLIARWGHESADILQEIERALE